MVSVDITDCEVVFDYEEENMVTCAPTFSLNSVVKTCTEESCCGGGKIFSKYRKSCVRKFFRD